MDDVCPRDQLLYADESEKQSLLASLRALCVTRLHASYWAWPTAFFTKNRYAELVERMEGVAGIAAYYGDLTGAHIWERWAQEYAVACALGAQAYTFHLIDYAPIDGIWSFSQSRGEILQANVFLFIQFLSELDQRGLYAPDAPRIEIENAGWGLEYGVQTAADFRQLFSQLHDPYDRVRIAWDVNHLLHALGSDVAGQARFFLPSGEIDPAMADLQKQFGNDPSAFAQAWIERNVLDPDLLGRIGSIHLSDCALNSVPYFKNGQLIQPYRDAQRALADRDAQEAYGVDIVLRHYDSHLPLGEGILTPHGMRHVVDALAAANPEFVVVHELKNSTDQEHALSLQLSRLWGTENEGESV